MTTEDSKKSATAEDRSPVDICIIGGAGHVGLPLGIVFANQGKRVVLFDTNKAVLEQVAAGQMPFIEHGADELLPKVIGTRLFVSSDPGCLARARFVIVAIGTPVDEYLNPQLRVLLQALGSLKPHLNSSQTIVIRSTVYPRTCAQIQRLLQEGNSETWKVAYCPERIAQGAAVRELSELPQLVAGLSPEAQEEASELFAVIAKKVIPVTIQEAELAKLFTNAWRYIQFAVANQFHMIAEDFGVDFNSVRKAITDGYGRANGLPTAGFAAGPCLLKDTMQLAAFNNNNFMLGHAAMMVNEGLPGFIVRQLQQRYDLSKTTVGILGMAFKGDIDDTRDSLSYKLGKILRFSGATVRYSDEFASDPTFISKEDLVNSCQVVVVGAPHSAYRSLKVPEGVELVDSWGIIPQVAGRGSVRSQIEVSIDTSAGQQSSEKSAVVVGAEVANSTRVSPSHSTEQ